MSRSSLYSVLVRLHRKHPADPHGLPDADLLERFVRLRDEAAFELLVWRHERMVLGVCRRQLRDEHEAEDAFQAAFLTLARKAASIGRREAVASWLYKVAYRCALRVREAVRRQRQSIVRGVDPADVAVVDSPPAVEREDLRELLDEEVQRLPSKYRSAVVLCYLEGKSYRQAAQELGCPAGTLSARLHWAREKLRRRLTARGLAPAAALALLESARETHAAAHLADIAVQAAQCILAGQSAADVVSARTLEIAAGVMQAISASKGKIAAIVLLSGCVFSTTGWAALRVVSAPIEKSIPQASRVSAPNARPEPAKNEKKETPLEAVLRKWAEADAQNREIHVRFTRTDTDQLLDYTNITKGKASIKRPDLWRVDRFDKQGRMLYILLLEDKRIHLFSAETKTERIFSVPESTKEIREAEIRFGLPRFVWSWGEQIHWLSFGPQRRDLDSRYKVDLIKQDRWYIYLDIEPRNKERSWFDWFPEQWFDRGQIVLERKTYQVRQVHFRYYNRDDIVVDFLDRQTNPKEPITKESLLKGLPQGWKREESDGAGNTKK